MRRTHLLAALAAPALFILGACGGGSGDGTTATPATTSPTTAATSPTSAATQAGGDAAALYADNCSGCQKADGSGGFGPDLRGEADAANVVGRVRDGGSSMPAFGDKLGPAQIQALADFVVGEL